MSGHSALARAGNLINAMIYDVAQFRRNSRFRKLLIRGIIRHLSDTHHSPQPEKASVTNTCIFRRLIEDQIVKGRSLVRRTLCAEPAELTGTDILSLPDHICQTNQPHSQPTDDR